MKMYGPLGMLVMAVSFAFLKTGLAETRYVSFVGGHVPPFTNWVDAATNIQTAIEAAVDGDTVLVTNGVYNSGGKMIYGSMINRIAIDKPITARSVNGPEVTFIVGKGPLGDTAVRCAYVGNGACLAGFTLTNGHTKTDVGSIGEEQSGGGAWCEPNGLVSNCIITGNAAHYWGGGACSFGVVRNCLIVGNLATRYGGGAGGEGLVLYCEIWNNHAGQDGGGMDNGTIEYCKVWSNAASYGGGTDGSVVRNSVLWGNAATNHGGGTHDGEAWFSPPSIGCDEYHAGSVTGSLSAAIAVAYTYVSVGFPVAFTALIEGRTTASRWNFGDGIVISNHPYVSHVWSSTGVYPVVLTAWNESYPQGVSATVKVTVVQAVHYVRADSPAPAAPFATWKTAASNIQDAVDAATTVGALVLVTNGVYDTGGRVAGGQALTNRVVIDKPLVVRSVNGPMVTIIQGQGPMGSAAVRCAYVADGALLVGFTLTNGFTQTNSYGSGGGLYCDSTGGIVSNCILTGNSASNAGGGACRGTLYNCTLSDNSGQYGGGAWYSALNHCTLTGNSAVSGGGTEGGILSNCTLMGNSAASHGGGAYFSDLYGCTVTSNNATWGGGTYYGTLYNCTLIGNSAGSGGGAEGSVFSNCTLMGNSATSRGGGAYFSDLYGCTVTSNNATWGGGTYYGTLYNCTLIGNSARSGGGAEGSVFYNCTLTGNSASLRGGGTYYGTLYNCIVYYNDAISGANYDNSTFNYSCTTPYPGGSGNITSEPQLASFSHLAVGSPCRARDIATMRREPTWTARRGAPLLRWAATRWWPVPLPVR